MREEVGINEFLLRRAWASPTHKFLNPDGSATSRTFKLRSTDKGELSVDVESLTTTEKSIKDQSRFMLFRIANKDVKGIDGLNIFHDPLSDGSNDAHAVITGMTEEDDIKPALLAKASKRVLF